MTIAMDFLFASLASGYLLYLFDPNNPLLETYHSTYIPQWATSKSKSADVYQMISRKRRSMPNRNEFIAPCPYCNKRMTKDTWTREHLVPQSMGGQCIILACKPCNGKRSNSMTFRPFVDYIEKHPFIYLEHVNKAICSDKMRDFLRSKIDPHIVHEFNTESANSSEMTTRSPKIGLGKDNEAELRQQERALKRAKAGRPIRGGRADRATRKAFRKEENKRDRRHFKQTLRKMCNDYNYADGMLQLIY